MSLIGVEMGQGRGDKDGHETQLNVPCHIIFILIACNYFNKTTLNKKTQLKKAVSKNKNKQMSLAV